MKICVLGSGGFIGSCVGAYLEEKHEVLKTKFRLSDCDAAQAFFKRHPDFDVILHMAGAATGGIQTVVDANVLGSAQLIDHIKGQTKNFQLLLFSSGAVYGNGAPDSLSLESDPEDPLDYYASSKQASEKLFEMASELDGFDLTTLRLPSVYGPLNTKGVISRMVASAQSCGRVGIFGTGKEQRSLIDVRDVARVVDQLIEARWVGKLNVSSDEIYNTRDLAELIAAHFGVRIELKPGENKLQRMALSNTLMKSITGIRQFGLIKDYVRLL